MKALPKDLPPKSTVHDYLELWNWDGTLERVHHVLYVAVREQADGKQARQQRHRFAERKGCPKRGPWLDPSGYDAGTKIKGRKRHILVDTMGLLISVAVHPADVQDRDGAFQLLRRARRLFPFIERIFADGGYAGKKKDGARRLAHGGMAVAHREAFRCCRLRGLAQTLDCRTNFCVDQPQPPLGS